MSLLCTGTACAFYAILPFSVQPITQPYDCRDSTHEGRHTCYPQSHEAHRLFRSQTSSHSAKWDFPCRETDGGVSPLDWTAQPEMTGCISPLSWRIKTPPPAPLRPLFSLNSCTTSDTDSMGISGSSGSAPQQCCLLWLRIKFIWQRCTLWTFSIFTAVVKKKHWKCHHREVTLKSNQLQSNHSLGNRFLRQKIVVMSSGVSCHLTYTMLQDACGQRAVTQGATSFTSLR